MKQLLGIGLALSLTPFSCQSALHQTSLNKQIAEELSKKALALAKAPETIDTAALKILAAAQVDPQTIKGRIGLFCFSKIVEMQDCHLITEDEAPHFHKKVAKICSNVGVAKPILCTEPGGMSCGAQRVPGFPAIFCLGSLFAQRFDSEDALKAIIAHEIGHIKLHHGEIQIFLGMGINFSLVPNGLIFIKKAITHSWPEVVLHGAQLFGTYGATFLTLMKYSRATELSADRVAAQLYGKNKVINALEQSKKLLHIDEAEEFENEEPDSDNDESHTSALIVTIQPGPEKWHTKLWTWVKKLTRDHPSYDDRIEALKSSDK